MASAWPHPDSVPRYLLLVLGAAGGVVGAFFLILPAVPLAFVGALLLASFAVSHASAIHHLSPRLALAGVAGLGGGAILFALVPWPGVGLLALAGVAALAGAQWFDRRRTYGMAGLGLATATLGTLGLLSDLALRYGPTLEAWAAGLPGGATWAPFVVPWRLAWLLALVWLTGSGAWLLQAHAKQHHAAEAAGTAAPAQQP